MLVFFAGFALFAVGAGLRIGDSARGAGSVAVLVGVVLMALGIFGSPGSGECDSGGSCRSHTGEQAIDGPSDTTNLDEPLDR